MRQEGPVCDVPPQARRRRAPDFGAARVFLECKLPRVECPGCGIRSAAVPRAGRASGLARELEAQSGKLAEIAREDKRLHSACLPKEDLRGVFKSPDGAAAAEKLGKWLNRACRSWTKEIKELSKKVRRRREAIARAVELGVSNARVEAVNNKVKLTVRMGCGFRDIDNLIALAMLRCSNLPIKLPGRA